MTLRSAAGALVRGAGVVAGVVAAAVVAAVALVALGLPTEGRADDSQPPAPQPPPPELVVGLSLGDPVLQAGVVRAGEVVLARGLEVDVARGIARRLGIPRVRFVDVRPSSRLLASDVRTWNVAIAAVRPTKAAAAAADLSEPYLGADQAVVLRRGLPRLRTLAELRRLIVCAVRGSEGESAIAATVAPTRVPVLAPTSVRLLQLVQTGVCDAALVDATSVGRLVAGRGTLLGPVSARVETGPGYVVAVTRGGPVAAADVDRALRRLRADGTMHRLARAWLGIDPSRLLPLR